MSSLSLPPNLNGIQHYLQMADDYDKLALPISYWCCLFALKQGVKLQKAKEDVMFLNDLMKRLQTFKKQKGLFRKDSLNETDAQHPIKSVANHLLDWADSENKNHNNKNFIVKAYYSAYMLFNVCSVFGNLNEEISEKAKHAKCMAAASMQNLLNQDVRSSSGDTLNRDKEVIDMENTGLEYHIAEGTNDETKPDVVVKLVERFVKSLLTTSTPKEEKEDRDKAGTEEMLKTMRRCLNLLTPSNFEKILARIQALDINSEDQLAGVVKLFFEKAINNDPLRFFHAKKLPKTQEPEQVLDAPLPQPLCQPRESSVTPARAASSSAFPIDGNANTDILTDAEEGSLDLSKQTPPIPHQSLPPAASSVVNQQLVAANSGPIQDRLTQGNRQFFGRPIRPGNQHLLRLPRVAGGTINPNAPQALPYPGLNQPVLFVIGDQFNQQSPYLPYPANAPEYYPTLGNQPSGNVLNKFQQQPQAALQSYGYKQTSRYPGRYPGPPPAVYYQPQQPQQQSQKEPQVSAMPD